ncbi:rhodanese family protein [Methylobrevis albus]|uniref:Rhodanese family protein n=1 Tax=Methylobrevis albus TaxID=2793297 RepID=A0A931I575_9HYPH|nr:rhodanese family protein [Methylobrevis albus]MBH0239435.1 rhodanese family protein [Methylobrevis albus]
MSLETITARDAEALVAKGATLVDIRDRDEHARENIPGAVNRPVAALSDAAITGDCVIFHCRSGNRTSVNAATLKAAVAEGRAYILEGGIEGWKDAGLPVRRDRSQPIEIMRQVQIGAGSLVFIGVMLGLFVAPGFFAIPAFIGAGLTFAGITGWCGMAKVLALMPWNRRAATGPALSA